MDSAAFLQADSSLDVIKTFAPAEAKPEAIIKPIPRLEPVIRTFFPVTEKRVLADMFKIVLFIIIVVSRKDQSNE